MNIARALLESKVEQPVADVNDVLVVGIELSAATELHELLEIGDLAVGPLVLLACALHRAGEVVELDDVALDVEWIRYHPLDVEPQYLFERFLPVAHVR